MTDISESYICIKGFYLLDQACPGTDVVALVNPSVGCPPFLAACILNDLTIVRPCPTPPLVSLVAVPSANWSLLFF